MKNKIEKLNEEQVAQLSVYSEKWLKIGLSTERANRSAAENALREAYKEGGLPPPPVIVWVDSPRGGLIAAKLLKEFFQKYPKYGREGEKVQDQVGGQVLDQVLDQVWGQVGGQVRDQVRDKVWDQVRAQVRAQVWDQVRGQFSALRAEWDDLWFWGQHDAGWLSYYDYFKDVCGLEICKRLDPLMRLTQESGWVWMYCGFAVITERPIELYRNDNHRLHNRNGAAVKYADGYTVYAMGGVRVPEILALTPAAELDAKDWLKEENVDIRREAFQKIGIEKVIKDLGAEVIDSMECPVGGLYELLILDIGLDEKKPYLRMQNPSLNVPHIEGVENGIKTVKDALAWRNGLKQYIAPVALT